MEFVAGLILGSLIGCVIATCFSQIQSVGTLEVDDTTDIPYYRLLMEETDIPKIANASHVKFTVKKNKFTRDNQSL